MVARGQTISVADLDSLATLANAKLGTAIAFPAFAGSDKINLPQTVNIQPTYDPAAGFTDGQKVTLYLYGYKTIGGRKTYSWQPVLKAFTGQSGSGNFSITAIWANPATNAPDGYIAVIPYPLGVNEWEYVWSDLGNVVTFTQDGNFAGWRVDFTLDSNNSGVPDDNLPCGHGAWLKPLNSIHKALFAKLDLFGGATAFNDTFLVSGPWCVSAGKSLYARLNGKTVYKNLAFYFPADQSPVALYRGCEVINTELRLSNPSANHYSLSMTPNFPAGIASGTFTGRVDFIAKGAGADNFANWGFSVGSGMAAVWSFDSTNIGGEAYGILTANFNGVNFTATVLNVIIPAGTAINQALFNLPGGIFPDAIVSGVVHFDGVASVESNVTGLDYANTVKKATFAATFPDDFSISDGINVFAFGFQIGVLATCDGVYAANTLETLGEFVYLDQDLPNYSPSSYVFDPDSRRRTTAVAPLVPQPQVGNRQALWPFFRDTDFAPATIGGFALRGSNAWQSSIGTESVSVNVFNGTVQSLNWDDYSLFVSINTKNVRWYLDNPNAVLYVRANDFPTLTDYDAKVQGGNWISLKDAVPGFQTDTTWFYSVYNPTDTPLGYSIRSQVFTDLNTPNGTFFPTIPTDDGTIIGALEGISYHFSDAANTFALPTPLLGYCIYDIMLERNPTPNGAGIYVVPKTNSDLQVKVGVMRSFGFDTAGAFEEFQTFTIPAGQGSVRTTVFWPVTSGTPLAYQCAEPVVARASVNFQPAMNSQYKTVSPLVFNDFISGAQTPIPSSITPLVNGQPQTLRTLCWLPWYNQNRALLFFKESNLRLPIVLPISAAVYNDLEATLNLLP